MEWVINCSYGKYLYEVYTSKANVKHSAVHFLVGASLPNAMRHQREPKAKRLLGDRGPWLGCIVSLRNDNSLSCTFFISPVLSCAGRPPRDRRLEGSSVNAVAQGPQSDIGVKSHGHTAPVASLCCFQTQSSTWFKVHWHVRFVHLTVSP